MVHCEIQKLLPRDKRGRAWALIWGWPGPVPVNARTIMPPIPRHSVWGPAARAWARQTHNTLDRLYKRGVAIPWPPHCRAKWARITQVIRGQAPLRYRDWRDWTQVVAEAEARWARGEVTQPKRRRRRGARGASQAPQAPQAPAPQPPAPQAPGVALRWSLDAQGLRLEHL